MFGGYPIVEEEKVNYYAILRNKNCFIDCRKPSLFLKSCYIFFYLKNNSFFTTMTKLNLTNKRDSWWLNQVTNNWPLWDFHPELIHVTFSMESQKRIFIFGYLTHNTSYISLKFKYCCILHEMTMSGYIYIHVQKTCKPHSTV